MTAVISGDTGIDLVQDNVITTADLQNGAVTAAKLSGAQTGSAPVYGCRAWGVFTGTTGALLASGNTASVSRTSTGIWVVTFTTAMPDANYSVNVGFTGTNATGTGTNRNCLLMFRDLTTTGFNIVCTDPTSGTATDSAQVAFQVFR